MDNPTLVPITIEQLLKSATAHDIELHKDLKFALINRSQQLEKARKAEEKKTGEKKEYEPIGPSATDRLPKRLHTENRSFHHGSLHITAKTLLDSEEKNEIALDPDLKLMLQEMTRRVTSNSKAPAR